MGLCSFWGCPKCRSKSKSCCPGWCWIARGQLTQSLCASVSPFPAKSGPSQCHLLGPRRLKQELLPAPGRVASGAGIAISPIAGSQGCCQE